MGCSFSEKLKMVSLLSNTTVGRGLWGRHHEHTHMGHTSVPICVGLVCVYGGGGGSVSVAVGAPGCANLLGFRGGNCRNIKHQTTPVRMRWRGRSVNSPSGSETGRHAVRARPLTANGGHVPAEHDPPGGGSIAWQHGYPSLPHLTPPLLVGQQGGTCTVPERWAKGAGGGGIPPFLMISSVCGSLD